MQYRSAFADATSATTCILVRRESQLSVLNGEKCHNRHIQEPHLLTAAHVLRLMWQYSSTLDPSYHSEFVHMSPNVVCSLNLVGRSLNNRKQQSFACMWLDALRYIRLICVSNGISKIDDAGKYEREKFWVHFPMHRELSMSRDIEWLYIVFQYLWCLENYQLPLSLFIEFQTSLKCIDCHSDASPNTIRLI